MPNDKRESVFYDVIEQENDELNLSYAFEEAFAVFGFLPNVSYELRFAQTKNEKRAFRFLVSGPGVKKVLEGIK